ncbi:hypothetical protein SNL152K_791 [Streptomyces sp. NL15-2K]|nr:hypothetical protein SNL152K_791 [Streptomyces sp. NL15-2K]
MPHAWLPNPNIRSTPWGTPVLECPPSIRGRGPARSRLA